MNGNKNRVYTPKATAVEVVNTIGRWLVTLSLVAGFWVWVLRG